MFYGIPESLLRPFLKKSFRLNYIMFSKWFESAKDSASQLLSAGKTVLQDVYLFSFVNI